MTQAKTAIDKVKVGSTAVGALAVSAVAQKLRRKCAI